MQSIGKSRKEALELVLACASHVFGWSFVLWQTSLFEHDCCHPSLAVAKQCCCATSVTVLSLLSRVYTVDQHVDLAQSALTSDNKLLGISNWFLLYKYPSWMPYFELDNSIDSIAYSLVIDASFLGTCTCWYFYLL